MTLYLVQYLCPNRHAIGAAPYDRDQMSEAEIEGALIAGLYRLGVNPWCGLCGSRELHFEHGRLAFQDWATAIAALRASEADQAISRLVLSPEQRQN